MSLPEVYLIIAIPLIVMWFGVMWWGKNHPDPDSERRRSDKDGE